MDTELVSIIIPCYNSAKYLNDAIGSVLCQTYTNWECIIIDDGSADESISIVNSYSESAENRIFLYANAGKGASAARNFGMEKSEGKYIKFLDSDDAFFDKYVLEQQLDFIRSNKYDIVYGNEIYYRGIFTDENIVKKRGGAIHSSEYRTFYENFPITSGFLIKRDKFQELKWNEDLRSGQEFYLLFQCWLKGLTFGYLDINAAKIRIHSSVYRISNAPRKNYADQIADLYRHIHQDIKRAGVTDPLFLLEYKKQLIKRGYESLRRKNRNAARSIFILLRDITGIRTPLKIKMIIYSNFLSIDLGFLFYKIFTYRKKAL